MEKMKLTNICTPKQWKTIPTSQLLSNGYPVYGANGIIGYYKTYNHEQSVIAITCRGASCGTINITRPQSYITGNAMCLDNVREDINLKYLYYNLLSFDFNKVISGSAQPQITRQGLEKVEISICPPTEQISIVSILTSIESLVLARKKELNYLDELVKARFVEMFGNPTLNPFGWRIKRFDEIGENLDSRRKPVTSSDRKEGIYPYYGASGIVDYVEDYIFDEDILLISEDGANLLMRSTPIAFSVSGKVWVNNHAHVVRFKDMSMQNYVEKFFSLIDITGSITGSAQPKLNQSSLNAMLIPIPEKRLLDSYLDIVRQVNKSKVAVQKALDEAQTLFDSLMQKYFG